MVRELCGLSVSFASHEAAGLIVESQQTWRDRLVSLVSHEAAGSIGRTHGATILRTGGS